MIEEVHTSETSVTFNETTRRYRPEGCHLHTRRRENLNSHKTTNVIKIGLTVLRLFCALGQTDGLSDFNKPFAGLRTRLKSHEL